MKSLLLALLFITTSLTAQDQRLARVKKMQGKELYILAEPLRAYEIVSDKHQRSGKFFSKGGASKMAISTKLEVLIKKMLKESIKEGYEFDALLYEDGKRAFAIKFTEAATEENERIAKVRNHNGMPVFIMNDPITDYTIIKEKRQRRNFSAMATAGWKKRSIEKDIDRLTDRLKSDKEKGNLDALHYTYGQTSTGIKFE